MMPSLCCGSRRLGRTADCAPHALARAVGRGKPSAGDDAVPFVQRSCQPHRLQTQVRRVKAQSERSELLSLASDQLIKGLEGVAGAVAFAGRAASELQQSRPGMQNFPPGPPGDVVLQLLADPVACVERLANVYGGAVGLQLGGERCVLVSDPKLVSQVVIDNAANFVKEGTAFFPGSSLAGNGLLVSDGDVWKRQRKLSNPAFRTKAVESYKNAMEAATERMLMEKWQATGVAGQAREVYPDFNVLTLEIIADAVFGTAIEEEEAIEVMNGIVQAFEYFGRRAAVGFVIPEWLPTPENNEYQQAVNSLDSTVYRIIADRRAALDQLAAATGEEPKPKGLIDQLLLSKDEEGNGMSDKELRDEIMTMMVAGQETSAILLTWACSLLAWHPEIQAKAQREIDAAANSDRSDSNHSDSMPFLDAILLETMRVLPPAYMVGRCAKEDVSLGGYDIPKGTTMLIGCVVMHRDRRWWGDNVGKFVPDRWMSSEPGPQASIAGNSSLTAGSWPKALSGMGENGAYLPFGGGPRNCIGTGFAMMEAKLVLSKILQRFSISPPEPDSQFPKPQAIITLRPPPGVELKLAVRDSSSSPLA